jgi:hypothetical protein
MSRLNYISDEDLYREVKAVLDVATSAADAAEDKLYNNVIDPFSAVMDSMRQGITLSNWLEQEKARQVQKSMQNALGTFHQRILGCVEGWRDLGNGGVLDLENNNKKVIAEIKNKHNTTKGNHKKEIYNDILSLITSSYKGYTGYYVEIIPKSYTQYDEPFTPSDNVLGGSKPANQQIRITDGKSFYCFVTGSENALDQLYIALPHVIADLLGSNPTELIQDPTYQELFSRAYPFIKK